MSGINEKGLCYDTNWLPREKLTPQPEKLPQNEWIVTKLMQEAATVEEVLARIFDYNWGDSLAYQVHFADKTGDAAIIYPGLNGEVKYSRRPADNDYLISTNFNHARRLRASYPGLDLVYKMLFDSKYNDAAVLLAGLEHGEPLTIEFMASVLEATHRNWWLATPLSIKTIYSTIFDPPNLQVYLYCDRRFDEPYIIDVGRQLAEGTPYRKIPLEELVSGKK
jgi:hypothetical protein